MAAPASHVYRAQKFVRRHRPAVLSTAAGIMFLGLIGVTIWSFLHRNAAPIPKPANKGTIVLGEFTNSTGDPVFDGMLRQLTAGELGKSHSMSVLPDARISGTLRLMVRPADTKLTPDIASEICERTGSAGVVEGSISGLGRNYTMGLRARNCRTGDILAEEQATAPKNDDVLQTLGLMADRFRTRAESLPPVEKEPSLPNEVTTPSLEAWRSYSAAMKAQQRQAQNAETISLLKRAIEIDRKFAMAYAQLGRLHASLGESELGAQNIAKAYSLRKQVSDRENYEITFNYHRQVTRNLELARQTLESWIQMTPRDFLPHGFLAAFTSQGSGHYEKAAEEGLKAIGLVPDYAIGYQNVAFAYIYMNRLPEADALLRRAAERKIDVIEFSVCRYFLSFLMGDQAAMEREITHDQARFEAQGWFEHQQALTLAYHGQLREAAQLSDRAVVLSRQAGLRERAALFEGARAVWSALFGVRDEAQKAAESALSLYHSRDADYGPAFALSLVHNSVSARTIQAELEKRYPEDTSVQFSYLPALRALDALNQGGPAKALELTHAGAPYDFAVPGTAFYSGAFYGALYPVYVRGLAYSRMRRHREAAVEFQKIIDHSYITLNDPIGPMARLQLARSMAASGDRAKSAAVYQELLGIWKDADPDLPVVQQAKIESAKQL
jgi:tetratricopeptide (TPR) repeat protein